MFEINVDEKGYYAEGNSGILVEVEDIPSVTDVRFLSAYKYSDGNLTKDEEKYAKIDEEIKNGKKSAMPTSQERLEAMESAIMELACMIGGVQNG